jgi:hypothetical protein
MPRWVDVMGAGKSIGEAWRGRIYGAVFVNVFQQEAVIVLAFEDRGW